MKHFAYSFLLIVLLSCGTTRQENYRSRILFRDSTIADYILLSVRNDAAVVAEYSQFSSGEMHPKVIPFTKILLIYQEHSVSTHGIWYGSAIGFGAGLGGTLLASAITHKDQIGIGAVPFLCGGIGAVIGCTADKFQETEKVCTINDMDDRQWLKQISRYPDNEPETLQQLQ